MTDDRSLERAARSFIEAGPTQAPDRAIEAALLLIETTPQERDLRVPWRIPSMTTPARVAVAALVGVLLVGAAAYYFERPGQPAVGVPGPSPAATASPNASAVPTSSAAGGPTDYAGLQGWIVFEHFGQAPDGSTTTFDADRRQIWLVHADGSNLHELAPGNPIGKASPDISPDGNRVIFNSWEGPAQIWEASIEGGEPVLVSTDCAEAVTCREHDPTYSPDGKRVAFMRVEGAEPSQSSVIGVRDLETHQVTLLETTRSSSPQANSRSRHGRPTGHRSPTTATRRPRPMNARRRSASRSSTWTTQAVASSRPRPARRRRAIPTGRRTVRSSCSRRCRTAKGRAPPAAPGSSRSTPTNRPVRCLWPLPRGRYRAVVDPRRPAHHVLGLPHVGLGETGRHQRRSYQLARTYVVR